MKKVKIYPLEILLIKSCTEDISMVKKMLNSTKVPFQLHIVSDAKETYAFLQKSGEYKNALKPDAIICNVPNAEFEKRINDILNTQILFLKITGDKIEITKSDKNLMAHTVNKLGITHIMEAIVSVKKFMGSLMQMPEQDKLNSNHKHLTS